MRPEDREDDYNEQEQQENLPSQEEENAEASEEAGHSDYKAPAKGDTKVIYHLSGMYQHWFLDYASYVILERAAVSPAWRCLHWGCVGAIGTEGSADRLPR